MKTINRRATVITFGAVCALLVSTAFVFHKLRPTFAPALTPNAPEQTPAMENGIPHRYSSTPKGKYQITSDPSDASDRLNDSPRAISTTNTVSSEYARLSYEAEHGDITAAKKLHDALEECQTAPRSQRDMDELAMKAHDPTYTYNTLPGGAAAYVRDQQRLFDHCGALSDRELGSLRKWVAMLAAAGDSQARLEYPDLAQPSPKDINRTDYAKQWEEFREKSKEYLNKEMELGNPNALLAMANGYMPPISQDAASAFGVNEEMAYAYYYAYIRTNQPGQDNANFIGLLASLESRMTPIQIEQAREEGTKIQQ